MKQPFHSSADFGDASNLFQNQLFGKSPKDHKPFFPGGEIPFGLGSNLFDYKKNSGSFEIVRPIPIR